MTARAGSSLDKQSTEPLLPESFLEQLISFTDGNSLNKTKACQHITSSTQTSDPVQNVENAVNVILRYFDTARHIMNNIYTQNDIQWVFESITAIKDIQKCITMAREYLPKFMIILEKHGIPQLDDKSILSLGDQLAPITNSPTLARYIQMQATKSENIKKVLEVADRIESANAQWQELHNLSLGLSQRMAVASEWAEFHNIIMTEIDSEIDQCFLTLSEIQEDHEKDESPIELDIIYQSLNQSSHAGCPKLPYQSRVERSIVSRQVIHAET